MGIERNKGEDMTPSYERRRDPVSVAGVFVGVLILSLSHSFPDSVAGGKHIWNWICFLFWGLHPCRALRGRITFFISVCCF